VIATQNHGALTQSRSPKPQRFRHSAVPPGRDRDANSMYTGCARGHRLHSAVPPGRGRDANSNSTGCAHDDIPPSLRDGNAVFASERRRVVATGGAKRNPWKAVAKPVEGSFFSSRPGGGEGIPMPGAYSHSTSGMCSIDFLSGLTGGAPSSEWLSRWRSGRVWGMRAHPLS
jgi:hypothetical protein